MEAINPPARARAQDYFVRRRTIKVEASLAIALAIAGQDRAGEPRSFLYPSPCASSRAIPRERSCLKITTENWHNHAGMPFENYFLRSFVPREVIRSRESRGRARKIRRAAIFNSDDGGCVCSHTFHTAMSVSVTVVPHIYEHDIVRRYFPHGQLYIFVYTHIHRKKVKLQSRR